MLPLGAVYIISLDSILLSPAFHINLNEVFICLAVEKIAATWLNNIQSVRYKNNLLGFIQAAKQNDVLYIFIYIYIYIYMRVPHNMAVCFNHFV